MFLVVYKTRGTRSRKQNVRVRAISNRQAAAIVRTMRGDIKKIVSIMKD